MKINKLIYDLDIPERIDYFMNEKHSEYSRTYFQKLIKSGNVYVNGKKVLPSHNLKKEMRFLILLKNRKHQFP